MKSQIGENQEGIQVQVVHDIWGCIMVYQCILLPPQYKVEMLEDP